MEFCTNVVTGQELLDMTESVKNWERRDCFAQLTQYLYGGGADRVCLLYGLRRTGKTTMLRQAILDMPAEAAEKTAYVKATTKDSMADINRDMKSLRILGYRYIFIDEATLMRDFIDSAALFSDIYAAQGMKIVLTGTDSLGFWLALHQELYDRAICIHTTFIPYREHSRLLGIHDIDEYIRYGGTLRAGEPAFGDADVNAADASFRDDESTRRYIDTAICKNIQHSLALCEDGSYLRHLQELYEANELTGAINRIIEDMNHRFLLSVLTRDFVSHDLGLAARNLRAELDPARQTSILDEVDIQSVTECLMKVMDIRNRDDQSVKITETHISEIKEYLTALDLIVDCPVRTTGRGDAPIEHILFTQPGMRYCQAQALVYALMKDERFSAASEEQKTYVTGRILEEVRGRMMEDITLLETMKASDRDHRVFKLRFAAGEFDMVIYDAKKNQCEIFEVKHSQVSSPEQYRHLSDPEMCRQTEALFGRIAGRYVLYRGEDRPMEDGITYLNIDKYLSDLQRFCIEMSSEEAQGLHMEMS